MFQRQHLHQNLLEAVREALNGSVPSTVRIPVESDMTDQNENHTIVKKLLIERSNDFQSILLPEKVKRYEEIFRLNEAGYSFRKIERELHCSRNTIKKYLNSDMHSVCTPTLSCGADKFHDHIVRSLSNGICRSALYRELQDLGLTCGKTAAYDYFNRIAELYGIELTPLESCTEEQKVLRKKIKKFVYVSRKKIFDYIWFDEILDIAPQHFEYLLDSYPIIYALKVCIREFRMIFEKGYQSLLYSFINKNSFLFLYIYYIIKI